MYHQHFKLSGPPFQFTPTPGALYPSKSHCEGLAALEWALLHEPTGFTSLVGESGIGKTTLIHSILDRSYENVRHAYVNSPKLNFDQMMQVVMSQFLRATGGQTKLDLIESFTRLLNDLAPGERLVIIIDEAQELADETLEEFRLLSNLDTAAERRLQVVLVGQPELIERLASPRMASLNHRIGARVLLKPLQAAEVREYIESRLRIRGGVANKIFASAALDHLVRHSRGLPQLVNVLCHNSMLLGFATERTKVNLTMARAAVNEFENLLGVKPAAREQSEYRLRPKHFARAALAVAAFVLVALAVVYVASSRSWFAFNPIHASRSGETLRLAVASISAGASHYSVAGISS
jgi:general secretion pathway protein A